MDFQSILGMSQYNTSDQEVLMMPKYFYDLNLDQIVQDIMDKQKLYDLRKFYYAKPDPRDIPYRIEVMKDIDNDRVFSALSDFSIGMRKAKDYLANITESSHVLQRQTWKLNSASQYITAVLGMREVLVKEELKSTGMVMLRNWLEAYLKGTDFITFQDAVEHVTKRFKEMNYNIQIKRDRIIIKQGIAEEDYCKNLLGTFGRSLQPEQYYMGNPFGTNTLSELEERIIEVLSKTYADTFQELELFNNKYQDFISNELKEFEKEVQFYLAFRQYRDEMLEMNFHFCYPKVGELNFRIIDGYDLALARKNAARKKEVVFNDCYYENEEKFLIITGPNQGGKTTFARSIGQILYFGMMGLMVPARTACFPAFDQIYTHFATEESMETGAGKLKEELMRLKVLMDQATRNSFIIINEIFTSATSYDAYIMGKRVIDYFMEKDCLGVYVTHIHELTKENDRVVSLVATLLNEDSNIRTFKIERRITDGRSYANTIVEKYHMTYEEIKERIRQ